MQYQPIINLKSRAMIFELEKPIYGSTYAIWDKWLKIAKREKLKLVVKTKEGTATFLSADEYLKEAKRIERYYKNPKVPMIFYQLDFLPLIKEREKRKKVERRLEDVSMPLEAKLKLKEKIKRENPDLARKLALL